MYKCPYCGKELRSVRGLAPHLRYSNCKERAIKRQFEEQGRQIEAKVHAMVEAKKKEFARSEELQKLADDIENSFQPLTVCGLCGNPWSNHKENCPLNKRKNTADEFLDFITNILLIAGGQ